MRRRPQPNRRRGLLRAAAAAVILIVLLVIAVLVTSSLVAPAAHAPAPVPPATISPPPTTAPAVRTPTVRPTASPKKTKTGLGVPSPRQLSDEWDGSLVRRVAAAGTVDGSPAVASPNGHWIVSVQGRGDAYSPSPLVLTSAGKGRSGTIAAVDRFVSPVWSDDSSTVLYVRAMRTRAFPGTRWLLEAVAVASGKRYQLAAVNAVALLPLGMTPTGAGYLVANSTDTSLYRWSRGRAHNLGMVVTEPIVSAVQSPDGRSIALATPTNCAYCTLAVFDRSSGSVTYGSAGIVPKQDIVWSRDSAEVVGRTDRGLAVFDPRSGKSSHWKMPAGLPTDWLHSMRATVTSSSVVLTDTVTGRQYRAES